MIASICLILLGSIHHLFSFPTCFDANSKEHDRNTNPLAERQLVLEKHDAQEHGKQFSSDRHHNERQATKVGDGFENEELSQATQQCVGEKRRYS